MTAMKDRIEGWTQEDEDRTFGLNGRKRDWLGSEPPTLEQQRGIQHMYRTINGLASKRL